MYTGRLAPAPTGALHLGNARTFLLAWLRARTAGGRLILRLEDLDHPKVKPGAAEQVYRDLAWLGLDWDAGPAASYPQNQSPPVDDQYIQSNRAERYRVALRTLRDMGRIYPCICTRKELDSFQSAPQEGDSHERRYPGICRGRFAGYDEAVAACAREPVWRFVVEEGSVRFVDGFFGRQEGTLSEWSGDFPVARGQDAGYQLAVVVDDHQMGVTEVVRGADLLPSTQRQVVLYQALGWTPPAFYHVPLVVGADGRRLAKRHGDTRLSCLRETGREPERVLGWLAWSCGWLPRPEPLSMRDVLTLYTPQTIPVHQIVVTPEDMEWLGFTPVAER